MIKNIPKNRNGRVSDSLYALGILLWGSSLSLDMKVWSNLLYLVMLCSWISLGDLPFSEEKGRRSYLGEGKKLGELEGGEPA